MKKRRDLLSDLINLNENDMKLLENLGYFSETQIDTLVENIIGSYQLPIGIDCNFERNNKDYLIPMAIEEPSVVAAASYAAKIAREKEGFFTSSTEPIMIGQIQTIGVRDPYRARLAILEAKEAILKRANEHDPMLLSAGGGAKDLETKVVHANTGPMVITELLVDCRDAMGANAVNTMVEAVSPMIERITGGRIYLRIISNLATKRLARSWTSSRRKMLAAKKW